ncbi:MULTISPECIES: SDR family NAD(P)-dependent oxidoreductase [Rhodococcus erythropolis group]|uniref:SDR family NAD(P)-dependent oxidoreductase n=1 Tax=Rhodococcus erythropolis group TaxID=2840174 RepID=UPI00352E1E41
MNLAIARTFAQSGASVSISGRTERKLIAAADELKALGARVCRSVADVRDAEEVAAGAHSYSRRTGSGDHGRRRCRRKPFSHPQKRSAPKVSDRNRY